MTKAFRSIYNSSIPTCFPRPYFNPLNGELNPISHLLALLGAHHILHFSRIRVKICEELFLLPPSQFTSFSSLEAVSPLQVKLYI
jgi:hypothetical protein